MEIVGVEFESVGKIYNFVNTANYDIKENDFVVVETAKGREVGKVAIAGKEIKREAFEYKPVIRMATQNDLNTLENLKEKALSIRPDVEKLIKQFKLDMKIVNLSFTFDSSKLFITFVSEERVDFRELVKKLASLYRVKIELHQIGARDEVKEQGGIGPCGRVCCCKNHLRNFEKVVIKMAKNQNLSLNPTKISGLCGKLMCCLAYEDETYTFLRSNLPQVGMQVQTEFGKGVVMYNDILKQQSTVKIQTSDGGYELKIIASGDLVNG